MADFLCPLSALAYAARNSVQYVSVCVCGYKGIYLYVCVCLYVSVCVYAWVFVPIDYQ